MSLSISATARITATRGNRLLGGSPTRRRAATYARASSSDGGPRLLDVPTAVTQL